MTESQMNRADFLASAVLVAFGSGIMVLSARMPRLEQRGINPYTAPGVVPFLLGAIITLLAVVLLFRSISRRGWKIDVRNGLSGALRDIQTRRLVLTLLMTLIYALVMIGRLDYTISTGLFIFAFILLFEWNGAENAESSGKFTPSGTVPRGVGSAIKRNRKVILWAAVEAVIASGITAAVFHYLFLVKLP
jgi:hypothetical protein